MANKIQPKQIYIDTVIAAGSPLPDKLYKGDVIQWNLTGGAAGNVAVLQSVDGTLIYNGIAWTTNYVDRVVLNRNYFEGFYAPTLSAGGVITITRAG